MRNSHQKSIYKRMQKFADLTNIMIADRNIERIKRAFAIAEDFLRTGNNELKNAVLNVYLYSISSTLEFQGEEGRQLLDHFPTLLRQAYHRQTIASFHD